MEEEIKVKKFSGELEDYPTWKREFTNKMGIKDLADFMLDPHPNPPSKQATADEKEAHNKKMKKLYNYIMIALDDKTAEAIEASAVRPGDGLGAWKAVLAKFERKDSLRMASLRAELARTTLEEGGDGLDPQQDSSAELGP
jgi:arabinogalactan endo-1,4-beta-galactosidase